MRRLVLVGMALGAAACATPKPLRIGVFHDARSARLAAIANKELAQVGYRARSVQSALPLARAARRHETQAGLDTRGGGIALFVRRDGGFEQQRVAKVTADEPANDWAIRAVELLRAVLVAKHVEGLPPIDRQRTGPKVPAKRWRLAINAGAQLGRGGLSPQADLLLTLGYRLGRWLEPEFALGGTPSAAITATAFGDASLWTARVRGALRVHLLPGPWELSFAPAIGVTLLHASGEGSAVGSTGRAATSVRAHLELSGRFVYHWHRLFAGLSAGIGSLLGEATLDVGAQPLASWGVPHGRFAAVLGARF